MSDLGTGPREPPEPSKRPAREEPTSRLDPVRIPVSDVMTRLVATTSPQARLLDAARLLRELHVSGIPVLEAGKVVGMLSERDLVRGLHEAAGVGSPRGLLDLLLASAPNRGESLLDQARHRLARGRVSELMSRPVLIVEPSTTLRDAAGVMRTSGVNRLPVVDPEKGLVGIVTRGDLLAALSGRERPERGSLHPAPVSRPRRSAPDPFGDI